MQPHLQAPFVSENPSIPVQTHTVPRIAHLALSLTFKQAATHAHPEKDQAPRDRAPALHQILEC